MGGHGLRDAAIILPADVPLLPLRYKPTNRPLAKLKTRPPLASVEARKIWLPLLIHGSGAYTSPQPP